LEIRNPGGFFAVRQTYHSDGQKQDKKYQGYSKSHAVISFDRLKKKRDGKKK
jgi:hypothetical protein